MRLLAFMAALAGLGAVAEWATDSGHSRRGGGSVVASALVLVGTSIALRRSILVALATSVAGMVVRLGVWFAGYRWVRGQHEDVRAYTSRSSQCSWWRCASK